MHTPITNVTQLLQGRTPGLTVMSASGQVGTASNFRIRGASSLSASNHPVFYVDGVRITSGSQSGYGTSGNTTRETSALDAINPDDIESIEVIKGPAAATLYGADAAAGVIQIITKKGRAGEQGEPRGSEDDRYEVLDRQDDRIVHQRSPKRSRLRNPAVANR